jgi:Txe/YoeB family toxin of Txe-Axe toxin-antitoxin module
MRLLFSEQAWEDDLFWQAHDAKTLERRLICRVVDGTLHVAQCRFHY